MLRMEYQDYYTFTLKSKCYVNFRLTHGYIDDDWDYFHSTVSNKSNSPIMEYSLSGTELGLNKGMVLPAGKYYVKVTSSNRHSTTPYGILVQPIINLEYLYYQENKLASLHRP